MTAYRFCRPDDIPRLVEAVEACWRPHFPGTPPLTVDGFRREMKELDLWPSNCMIALAGDDPVAVVTATKRDQAVLIRRVGVHPGHLRRGHARHVLTSLSQKLAVLGPPRLLAEVAADLGPAQRLFEALGYERETVLADLEREVAVAAAGDPVPEEVASPVPAAELLASVELPPAPAWERTPQTLSQRAERLAGLAAAGERVEAWLVYDPEPGPGPVEIWGAGWAEREPGTGLLALLLRALAQRTGRDLRLPRLAAGEPLAADRKSVV